MTLVLICKALRGPHWPDPGSLGGRGDVYGPLPLSSLAWPETWRERITYLVILPIIIPLWLTLPDTRKPSGAVPLPPLLLPLLQIRLAVQCR